MGFRFIIQKNLIHVSIITCQRGYRMNSKQMITTLLVLLSAALLEAGGDAVVRLGLRASTTLVRASLFLIGGLLLFTYGYVVNAPQWDLGRRMSGYVGVFTRGAYITSLSVIAEYP